MSLRTTPLQLLLLRALPVPYLIGSFGIPCGNWTDEHGGLDSLLRAGLNSLRISEKEIGPSRAFSARKIYALGLVPDDDWAAQRPRVKELFDLYTAMGDAYGYYLADDVNNSQWNGVVQEALADLRLTPGEAPYPMIGLISISSSWQGKEAEIIERFNSYDMFLYYYPLMRQTSLSLSEMLRMQTEIADGRRRQYGRSTFIFSQAVFQEWYAAIVDLNGLQAEEQTTAYRYPDGQVVRMLIQYAIATGADGFFLYSSTGLSDRSDDSNERIWAASQAILESKPLLPVLENVNQATFLRGPQEIFGTQLETPSYGLYFFFKTDSYSQYHPSTAAQPVKIKDLKLKRKFKYLYEYSLNGLKLINNESSVTIPQDHAMILIESNSKLKVICLSLIKGIKNSIHQFSRQGVTILLNNIQAGIPQTLLNLQVILPI